jgi:hypothetical protein
VIRFRWSEPDDGSTPVHWSGPALIVATVVLNFPFWEAFGFRLWGSGPPLRQLPTIAASSAIITCLFFVGPGLALRAAKRPLLAVVDELIGIIPATVFRLSCVVALSCWVGNLLGTVMNIAQWIGGGHSRAFYFGLAVTIVVFLFLTAVGSVKEVARLAMFTNKLGIAILVAALIRVRDGWPAVPVGFPDHGQDSWSWHGFSALSFFVGPAVFFAAGFAKRATSPKAVISIAAAGLALPLALSLVAVGAIGVATANSIHYRPSLNPTIAMALCSGVARSHLPAVMAIMAFTAFGALRFGIRALADTAGSRPFYPILLGAIAWVSLQDPARYVVAFDLSANVIAAMAAVLTANFITGRWPSSRLVSVVSLIAGPVLPVSLRWWDPNNAYYHPAFLPSHAVAFVVYLLLKALPFRRMVR